MQNLIKIILCFLSLTAFHFTNAQSEYWRLDKTTDIGGHFVQVKGNPIVIQSDLGEVVEFNGSGDGLIVLENPLSHANSFTIEITFKPYSGGGEEQRLLHILDVFEENYVLIELHNNDNEDWSLNTYIESYGLDYTLSGDSLIHPPNEWTHVAITYNEGKMEHYINGEKEQEGTVYYLAMSSGGKIGIGMGMGINQAKRFKGAIHSVRISHGVLPTNEFLSVDNPTTTGQVNQEKVIFDVSPNPITSSGRIKYQLEKPSNVSIKLVNIYGEEIMSLWDGFKNAGVHELPVQRADVIEGMYFVVLNLDNTQLIQKLLIY